MQRTLRATGDADSWAEFATLMQQNSGLKLTRAGNKFLVSYAQAGEAKSSELRDIVKKVIDSDIQAEIQLGDNFPNIVVGGFPELGDRAQRISMDHIRTIERGAPGHGVAKLIHELYENFEDAKEAHEHKDVHEHKSHTERYEHAHEKGGVAKESAVAKQLAASGDRVAERQTAEVAFPDGSLVQYLVNDFETHFLVYRVTKPAGERAAFRISDVRKANRNVLRSERIEPADAQRAAALVAAELEAHPTATAWVHGARAAAVKQAVTARSKSLGSGVSVRPPAAAGELQVVVAEPADAPDPQREAAAQREATAKEGAAVPPAAESKPAGGEGELKSLFDD